MWTVIAMNNVKGTVWESLDDRKVPLDIDLLEREFAAKKAPVSALSDKGPVKVIVQKISLLSAERVKNMEIVLGKLKLSNTAITEALFAIDEKVLTLNNVDSLLMIAPNDEVEVGGRWRKKKVDDRRRRREGARGKEVGRGEGRRKGGCGKKREERIRS